MRAYQNFTPEYNWSCLKVCDQGLGPFLVKLVFSILANNPLNRKTWIAHCNLLEQLIIHWELRLGTLQETNLFSHSSAIGNMHRLVLLQIFVKPHEALNKCWEQTNVQKLFSSSSIITFFNHCRNTLLAIRSLCVCENFLKIYRTIQKTNITN